MPLVLVLGLEQRTAVLNGKFHDYRNAQKTSPCRLML